MATVSNAVVTYSYTGNREDLSDIIKNVDPTATPFFSGLSTVKATSTKHEWLTRGLTAASSSNFVIEGEDATTDAGNSNTRVYNYTAISDKVAIVTGTQEAVTSAGTKSNMALEMADKMKELKRKLTAFFSAEHCALAA